MERKRRADPHRGFSPALPRPGVPLALLALLALSCGGPANGPAGAPARGVWHTFEGTGSSTGQVQTLSLGTGHNVSIINLTGSLMFTGERRMGLGFRSETIGFSDSLEGGRAWSVWTDSRGDKVFSELRGGPVGAGMRFKGVFLGGTGPYAGVSGEYEFEWQYVIQEKGGTIQGRAVGMRGRFRQESTPPSDKRSSRGMDERVHAWD